MLRALRPGRLDDEVFLEAAYRILLGRPPDEAARSVYLPELAAGVRTREDILADIRASDEHWLTRALVFNPATAVARSRWLWVRMLPAARRALVVTDREPPERLTGTGYPHPLDDETVVPAAVSALAALPGRSVDLVWAPAVGWGSPGDADAVLAEVARICCEGGWLAVDAPRAEVLQAHRAIPGAAVPGDVRGWDPAHLAGKLERHGFTVVEEWGLVDLPDLAAGRPLSEAGISHGTGVVRDPERGYLVGFLARR